MFSKNKSQLQQSTPYCVLVNGTRLPENVQEDISEKTRHFINKPVSSFTKLEIPMP